MEMYKIIFPNINVYLFNTNYLTKKCVFHIEHFNIKGVKLF